MRPSMTISARGGHGHVHRLGRYDVDRLAQKPAHGLELVPGASLLRRHAHCRVMADHDGCIHVPALRLRPPGNFRRVAERGHVHRQRLRRKTQMAVDARVERSGVGIARDGHPRGEVRPGILLAMGRHRQDAEVGAVSGQDHVLHRAGRDFPRRDTVGLSGAEALDHALGGGAERVRQVLLGREQVRHHGHRMARHALEHQHREAPVGLEPLLHGGKLPPGVDFAVHAHQQLGRIPLEHVEVRSEVRGHDRHGIRSAHQGKGRASRTGGGVTPPARCARRTVSRIFSLGGPREHEPLQCSAHRACRHE